MNNNGNLDFQTGSGKTFTMGTGFECEAIEEQEGIIPRAVRHLFSSINSLKENPYDENGICMDLLQFSVGAQFMELYNEGMKFSIYFSFVRRSIIFLFHLVFFFFRDNRLTRSIQ